MEVLFSVCVPSEAEQGAFHSLVVMVGNSVELDMDQNHSLLLSFDFAIKFTCTSTPVSAELPSLAQILVGHRYNWNFLKPYASPKHSFSICA